jgi:RND family efflux transporter MFP subunit
VSAQELERAQAAVEAARAQSQSSAAAVSQRRVQLQFYEVKVPVAGTVGDVLVRVGDFVTAQTQLTTVAQAEVLEVSVAVPAERARDVRIDMPVELLKSNGEVLLECAVFFIAPQADGRSQLVDVKALFKNTVGLRPNELVRTRLVYGVRSALQVPALAVTRQSGQTFVFAVTEKDGETVVTRRPVKLGPLGEKNFVVEAGLNEGDRIAVSSLQALRDGARIKPRPQPPVAGRP